MCLTVTVYGKEGCAKCDSCKDKLRRMDVPFVWIDLSKLEAWRGADSGAAYREGQAEYEWRERLELPLLLIDGTWHTYSEAMSTLKRLLSGNQAPGG